MKLLLFCIVFLGFVSSEDIKWCVKNLRETDKCNWMRDEVRLKKYPEEVINDVTCIVARDHYECLEKIDSGEADIVNLDAGTTYFASSNFVTVLLAAENYANSKKTYYSVAVVPKKKANILSPINLRGVNLCSSGVGDIAGWTLPLAKLAELKIMPVTACNVNVKTAAEFFGDMCAPGALNSYNNPFGDNPVGTCSLCGSTGSDWCTYNDKYAGGSGPLQCLEDGKGDVAFMKSIDVEYIMSSQYGKAAQFNKNDYELLCPQGGRKPIGQYLQCNWGETPANVFVTSGVRTKQMQEMYRDFLLRLSEDFQPVFNPAGPAPEPDTTTSTTLKPGPANANDTTTTSTTTSTTTATTTTRAPGAYDPFTLFNTNSTYGLNALVSSAAVKLVKEDRDGYKYSNGDEFKAKLDLLQSCSVSTVRFCVISEYEMKKCEQLLLALQSKNIRPSVDCILDTSTKDCMRKIAEGDADIIALDAGDIYEAGKYYNLVPIINENYGDTGNYYYAVAVSRQTESKLTLFNLMARNSCHGAMRTASGWIYPVLSLIETGQITPGKCEAIKKVGELFRRSCVPGILDDGYNKDGTNPINLCENCGAGGMDKCQRNTRELYYGDSGAFRCLVERGGDIAYVRHMTPRDNTDGRNPDHWARNRRSDDYELLCKHGKRAPITDWKSCYLAKVPAKAIVTADFKSQEDRNIYWQLLNYAQQFYSADDNPYFSLFDSGVDQNDLLFSDSTVRLVEVPEKNQTYQNYLGVPFLKAVNTLNQYECTSSAFRPLYSSLLIFSLICTFLVSYL